MIVRIVKDWKFPDIKRQSPGGKGVWDGIQFTEENLTECDVLVVFNRPPQSIVCKVRKGGAWLFSQESPIPIYEWHKKSFGDFDKVFTFWEDLQLKNTEVVHYQTALPWHVNRDYDFLKKLECPANKKDGLSWITSNATAKEGHKLRMSLLEFLENSGFSFDLFGRGFQPIEDKFDGIFPYKYSLAIENYSCNDYWTEKLADCFLSWTLPIYYGCKNIFNYFPEDSMIVIDPAKPEEALQTIKNAIAENEWQKRIPAIEKARNLVLDHYQLFPMIASQVKKFNLPEKKKLCVIPENDFGKLARVSPYLRLKSLLS